MTKPISVTGAVMVCDKGTTTVPLVASGSASVKLCNVFAAIITDIVPSMNIFPFGLCAITKMPCFPIPVGNWVNPFDHVCIIGNTPSLLEGAKLPCAVGGTISVMSASQAAAVVGHNLLTAEGLLPTRTGQRGIDLMMRYEKLELKKYDDGYGNLTIGVGHLLTPAELASGKLNIGGAPVDYTSGLSRQQALDLFRQDLGRFERAITNRVKVPLNQNQFDALVSYSFNRGEGWLKSGELVNALDRGNMTACRPSYPSPTPPAGLCRKD